MTTEERDLVKNQSRAAFLFMIIAVLIGFAAFAGASSADGVCFMASAAICTIVAIVFQLKAQRLKDETGYYSK